MGLNESYSAIRGQILLIDPLPIMNKAYSLVLQEERQRTIYSNKMVVPETTAFAAKRNPNMQDGRVHKNMGKKKEHPKCEHFSWTGRTIGR